MKIDNLSDITIEQLQEAQNSINPENVTIAGTEYGREEFTYTISEAIQIKKAIQELIDSIPQSIKENKKEAFAYVYVLLGFMLEDNKYHEELFFVSGYYLDRAEDAGVIFDMTSSNDLTGILTKSTLWHGKNLILEEVAKGLGLEAKTIYGGACFFDRSKPFWSWLQVKIDGIWYNCDLQRDQPFLKSGVKLPHFLKSDADYKKMYDYRYKKPETCTVSVSDEEQERLITPIREKIVKEREERERALEEERIRRRAEEREAEVDNELQKKLKRFPSFLRPYIEEKLRRKIKEKHIKRHGAW